MLRARILDKLSDLVADFMYYSRKEDFKLPPGVMERAIADEIISSEEIAEEFKKQVEA